MAELAPSAFARRHRRWIVAATIALLVAIVVTAPHYNDAQTAASATAFRRAVAADGSARLAIAAMLDVGFSLSYGMLALAFAAGRNRVARLGAGIVGVGAGADVAENLLVLLGALRPADLSDGTVTVLRSFGACKWAGVVVGTVLLVAGRVADRR